MKFVLTSPLSFPLVPCVALAFGSGLASPSHAVLLEQRWQPGQTLPYELGIEGVANVQLAPEVPFFLAGVPLEIAVEGDGRARLETVAVDRNGTGTLAWDIPKLKIEAQTFGQKVTMNIENGTRRIAFAGRPLGAPAPTRRADGSRLAVKISREGRLVGVETLAPTGATGATVKQNDSLLGATPERVASRSALFTNLLLQALPAVWPGRDVKEGESWKCKVVVPEPAGATPTEPGNEINEVTLTLRDREVVEGRELWRVAMKGTLGVPGADALQVGTIEVDSARLGVDGDLWFDAQKGRIDRGEVALESRVQGRQLTTSATGRRAAREQGEGQATPDKKEASRGGTSWFDFAGTVRFELDEQ